MPAALRLTFNAAVVAALTFAGIMAMLQAPTGPLAPTRWAGEYFEPPVVRVLWFAYTVLLWALPAAAVAACMLILKPRRVALYGLVSAVTFVVTLRSWQLLAEGDAFILLREAAFALTIPAFYAWAVRWCERRDGRGPGPAPKLGPVG